MAAIHFDEFGEAPEGGGFTVFLNWLGAALSVALIVGLGFWGWQLWQRDVSGVPVVRALEGPMRVAPADPGGLASDYQGLSVNRIAEERGEASLADRVVLAPAPAELNEEEDVAMAALPVPEADPLPVLETQPVAAESVEIATVEPSQPVLVEEATSDAPSATDLAVAAALDGLVLEDVTPVVLAAAHVPLTTPRPLVRPASLNTTAIATDSTTGDLDAATIPAGTRLVQLGAFGSPEDARVEWANALANFGDYMTGKERVIQKAHTGGRDFYRLRAFGFSDLADARRFCAVLVSDGANCIPVVQE